MTTADREYVEALYKQQIKPLPAEARLRLLALMAQDLAQPPIQKAPELLTITERLARANYQGGALFKTADEVDSYIQAERDSWER